ncbi:MAG: hypothetical protein WCK21_10845 [Actinomycetota bacterium]
MTRVQGRSGKTVVQRIAPLACAAIFGVAAAACGSESKIDSNNNKPTPTVPSQATPAPSVTVPPKTTPAPTTTAPQSGGAGF